jgi:hypothetical protein
VPLLIVEIICIDVQADALLWNAICALTLSIVARLLFASALRTVVGAEQIVSTETKLVLLCLRRRVADLKVDRCVD